MNCLFGMLRCGALVFLASFAFAASAQQAAVFVDSSGTDLAGQQLVYQVREALRRSAGLKLVEVAYVIEPYFTRFHEPPEPFELLTLTNR